MSDFFHSDVLSVSELNAFAKSLLENHLAGLWIAGEVSNLTRAASGHYYFSLKDSRAQVRCAMFKGAAVRLAKPLKEGDHIEVSGKISIYEARGEFQITVNEVRLKGLGQLYEAYERLKAQLQAEGAFAAERKKPLPVRPQCIGIVTSPAAAALRDVVTTLKRRAPEIPVIVYPTPVQGAGSELQIAQAIKTASQRAECDVLIVCRGGGSIEDLWAFNEEPVVRAIESCTVPVVSGVGHETDFTLADFVADMRAHADRCGGTGQPQPPRIAAPPRPSPMPSENRFGTTLFRCQPKTRLAGAANPSSAPKTRRTARFNRQAGANAVLLDDAKRPYPHRPFRTPNPSPETLPS